MVTSTYLKGKATSSFLCRNQSLLRGTL